VQQAHPAALLIRTSLLYGSERQASIQRDVAAVLAGRSHMRFFTDEYRCPAHAADVAAAITTLAGRPDVTGALHVAGPQLVSRADLAAAFATAMGADPRALPTATLRQSGLDRPAILALDSSRAASLGIRCRSLQDALGQ
jgi:dTDP-4-dehydrorhamnose reductase